MKLPNHLISAVFFILINSFCFSQDVKEVWKYTEQGKDLYVIDLEYDKKGNTYLLGVADDTLAVNTELQGEVTLYSTTKRTYFLEKLNHKGNLLWVKNLSEHSISKPEKFALNKSGEIVLLTSKSDGKNKRDYFLQIYTGEGKLILDKKVIKNVFYQNNIDVKQMILNDDNSIFVLGNFTKHLVINGLKDTLHAFERYDSDDFILKVSEKGEYKWIIKTTGRESARISQIESDKKGNVYFAGSFAKKCILGKDTLINDKEGNQLFFGKLNSKGEVETLKKFNRNYSSPSCIFPDEQGNVYLTGTFTKQIEEHNPTNPNWYYKRFGFITKLNSQFETIWIKKDSSSGWFYSEAKLSINKDSSIYWLGRFPANIDYDPSRVIFTPPRTNYNGNYDHDRVAVKHLSAKGEFLNMYLFPERNYFFYRLKILENQDILHAGGLQTLYSDENYTPGIYVKRMSGIFNITSPLIIRSCESYYWKETNKTYTKSGIYFSNSTSVSGKNDVLQLDLTIETIDKSVRKDEKKLYSNAKDVAFQWLDCENGYKPIEGEIDSVFQFKDTGTYSVKLTSKYCDIVDTSECISVNMIGIHPNDKSRYYSIDFNYLIDKIEREHIPLDGNEVKMIPMRDGRLYGFVKKGKTNKWLIKPRFKQVFAVYKEGAIVKDSNEYYRYGMVDKKGNYLIPPVFENLFKENGVYHGIYYSFDDTSLNRLGGETNHYVHYYYNEKGKLLFSERAHEAESFFYEDYAWFRFGRTVSIYNKQGELVKRFKIDREEPFIGIADNKLLFYKKENKIVAYSMIGEIEFEIPTYSMLKTYKLSDNLFVMTSGRNDYYFLDSLGKDKYRLSSEFFSLYKPKVEYLHQNQFIVRDDNLEKMGVINRKGETVLPFNYLYIGPLTNGFYFCVDSSKKQLFINEAGKPLDIERFYKPFRGYDFDRSLLIKNYGFYEGLAISSRMPPYSDSLAKIDPDYYEKYKNSEYYSYYDTNGIEQLILLDTIKLAGNFSDGLAPALTKDKRLGFIDKKGNWAIEPKYELSVAGAYPMPYIVVPYFINGFAYIKSFKGYIDKEGNEYFTGKRMQDHYDFSH